MRHSKSQTGNILFLILLAVVLFAALSYAVTSSMRGGGKNASSENVKTQAAAVLGFFEQVDAAVMRMTLTGGVSIENLSFEYYFKTYGGTTGTANANSNCSSDSCRLFKPTGGNVSQLTFEKYAVANPSTIASGDTAPGYMDIFMFKWPYAGTDLNDIIMRFHYMSNELCQELVQSLGLPDQYTISITGNYIPVTPVSGWDSGAGRTVNSATQALIDKNVIVSGSASVGCTVYHLVYPR